LLHSAVVDFLFLSPHSYLFYLLCRLGTSLLYQEMEIVMSEQLPFKWMSFLRKKNTHKYLNRAFCRRNESLLVLI
jgi:hypothetical protein